MKMGHFSIFPVEPSSLGRSSTVLAVGFYYIDLILQRPRKIYVLELCCKNLTQRSFGLKSADGFIK